MNIIPSTLKSWDITLIRSQLIVSNLMPWWPTQWFFVIRICREICLITLWGSLILCHVRSELLQLILRRGHHGALKITLVPQSSDYEKNGTALSSSPDPLQLVPFDRKLEQSFSQQSKQLHTFLFFYFKGFCSIWHMLIQWKCSYWKQQIM